MAATASSGSKRAAFLSLLAAILLLLFVVPRLWVELAWFEQFGLKNLLLRRWTVQGLAFITALGLGIPLQLQQLQRCWNLRSKSSTRQGGLIALKGWGFTFVLALLLGLLLLGLTYLLTQARGLINAPFNDQVLSGFPMLTDLPVGLLLSLAVALLFPLLRWPLSTLRVALAAALVASATALARGWSLWLPALMAAPFGQGDPVTGLDLSFTVLQLPALRLVLSVLIMQLLVGLAACLWISISGGNSLSDWHFSGLTKPQQRVLQPQLAALALVAALIAALSPYELMISGHGVAAGAGFVDLHVRLPLRLLLALLLLLSAAGLMIPLPAGWLRRGVLVPLACTGVAVPIAELLIAPVVQRLMVQPRELQLERPYLERTISATRKAFGLDQVQLEALEPRQALTAADLKEGPGTIENLRLWDTQPLLATNRQLQQLRLYYSFPSAAVDRYGLSNDPNRGAQQVLIAPRELDANALPGASRTWQNLHMVFTHGYGFTVSPVNAFGPDGLPLFFIKDLGRNSQVQGFAELDVTSAEVKREIPVGNPRLYFGYNSASYAIAPTKVKEFDYPEGDLNIYSHYQGSKGIPLEHNWQKIFAAHYLREPRLLFTGALQANSKLLLRRQIHSRLKAIAPFLRFENSPYLVTARLPASSGFRRGVHQFWFVDGFTTSRSYPYSEANPEGLRYLRNPVKALVDAYTGEVHFYVNDPQDPILRTWQKLFPELFSPIANMPKELRKHLQVPQSQFAIQAEKLLRFHVTDVRTFYNGDDVWGIPLEIYGNRSVAVRPYHVTLQLPGEKRPEFVLLLPFSPLKRPNLVGWLAARNDGDAYGKLKLVRFPQERLLLGTQQITALIEQDPVISGQFGLWNRQGSEVVQGNLLVVPIGKGLLYVEPIYLKARNGGLPTLVRVVVSDGRRFVMERNLNTALNRLTAKQANKNEN